MNIRCRLFLFLSLTPFISLAQEVDEHSENESHHRVSIMIAHTHIPKGVPSVPDGGGVIVPSWGFTYNYHINKWSVGVHADMEIATYLIDDPNGNQLERSRPIIVSIVGAYTIWHELGLLAGFGREFDDQHDFWVYRFGLEYGFEIGDHWDLSPAFIVDIKENFYDSFTVGLVVGRHF